MAFWRTESFRKEVDRFSLQGHGRKDAGISTGAMGFTGIDADSQFMRGIVWKMEAGAEGDIKMDEQPTDEEAEYWRDCDTREPSRR